MYMLTLTRAERRAISWVGHRYHNGNDLYWLLWSRCESSPVCDWDDESDITFRVRESVAWAICYNATENDDRSWPCFSEELAAKMELFCEGIV